MSASPTLRRARPLAIFLLALELLALLLGVGMPGAAWILAMLALSLQNVLQRWLQQGYLIFALLISSLHLLTFGPLPLLLRPWERIAMPPWWFMLLFILLPFLLSVYTLVTRVRQLRA